MNFCVFCRKESKPSVEIKDFGAHDSKDDLSITVTLNNEDYNFSPHYPHPEASPTNQTSNRPFPPPPNSIL